MQELKVFDFKGEQIAILQKDGEPWFVARNVTDVLGLDRTAIRRIDEEEKDVHSTHTPGGNQSMVIISEAGLYELIFASKKEEAKHFKRWVTKEVVPSIRKYGAYMTPETIEQALTDPDTIIRLATDLKEERAKRMAAEVLIQKQQPKVLFADAVQTSQTSILVGQLAKLITQNGYDIGQNRLFSWLRQNGYLGKKGAHYNEPTQYAVERGWFEVIERTVNEPNGSVRITRTTKVTGKGQIYFINKFLNKIGEGA
ncbi:phage antirepressor [Chryseomicrobium palamuruense]